MDPYVTGAAVRRLRLASRLTQEELAQRLHVSDKTVSKWETGRGHPDLSLLEPLAEVFGVSLPELLSGRTVRNENISANMIRSKLYVCPVCGNVIHSMGAAAVTCHGVPLSPCQPEAPDANHPVRIERVDGEYCVRVEHEMSKTHYISFLAALSSDRLQLVKLYPEWSAEARFRTDGVTRILFCCNRDGLFSLAPV